MPNTKQQNDIEFGWNGVDGYIRNNGKYQLLFNKPLFSFDYSSCIYSNDDQVDDLTIDVNGYLIDLTETQKQEIEVYAKTYAVNDPWVPTTSKNYITGLDVVETGGNRVIRYEQSDGSQTESKPVVPNTMPSLVAMDGDLLKVTMLNGSEYKVKVQPDIAHLVRDVVVTADDRLQITFEDGASKTYALPKGDGTGGDASITVESGSDVYVGVKTLNFSNVNLTDGGTTVGIEPLFNVRDGQTQSINANVMTVYPPLQLQPTQGQPNVANILIDPKAFAERDNHGYMAALATDYKLFGTSDIKVPRKEVLWFDQTVVSSEYIQIDRSNKAIGIQEDDDLDPNITGGTYFYIGLFLDSDTVALNDIDMTIRLVDKNTKAVINDFKGRPCSESGKIKQKQKVGIGYGHWLVKATALQEFQVEVIHNSTIGINFKRRANGVSCICVQSLTTANATGDALTQFQLETRHLYYITTKYYGTVESLGLSAVGSYINQSMTNGNFQITSDGWFLTSKANTGVVIGTDNHVDVTANTLGHWDIHNVLSKADTTAILGKAVSLGAVITDKDDAFRAEILSYNGASDWDETQALITDVVNDNPIYATGWSVVTSLFFSEVPNQGDHSLSVDVTLPASSVKNLALLIRPVVPQLPCSVKIKDLAITMKTPFTDASVQIKKFTDVPDFDVILP